MSYIRVWIHAVWATKKRQPLLLENFRKDIFNHIYENCQEKDILIDIVNGHIDHVHCLLRLKNDQTIKNTIQLMKGESSHWINKQNFFNKKFKWQRGYFAVSVSESNVQSVRNYIQNQESHHKKMSFQEEYSQFIKEEEF